MQTLQNTTNTIIYDKFNVISHFIFGIPFFALPIVLLFWAMFEEFTFIISLLFLLIIGGYFYFRICKAFIHILIDKPMIELTNEKYIDNLNGFSLYWSDINRISLQNSKAPFVVFDLKDNKCLYSDMNLLKKLFYKFERYDLNSIQTNIRFAYGKNVDIFTEVQNKFKKSQKS